MPETLLDLSVREFFDGTGDVVILDPGNMGNPPGWPPVQTGAGESGWVPPYAYQAFGHFTTDIAPIPPNFRDWGQYAVNVGDVSGLTGGGVIYDPQVNLPTEVALFVDPSTQLYYDLGSQT